MCHIAQNGTYTGKEKYQRALWSYEKCLPKVKKQVDSLFLPLVELGWLVISMFLREPQNLKKNNYVTFLDY